MEPTRKQKILVVEDENEIRVVLCAYLGLSGFQAIEAKNGHDAIELIPEHEPDLIILDLLMQPVNGWEVLTWLLAYRSSPPIPVIVLTALAGIKDLIRGLEEGAVEYMAKPVQPSKLVERVRTILELNPEQRASLRSEYLKHQRWIMERLYAPQSDEFTC